jgi:hypothetical protein
MVRLPALMFVVPVHTAGFPLGTVPPTGQLRFSPDALAWALFTTGRLPGDATRYGTASLYECVHRVAIIPAYIRRRAGGAFVRSQLCIDLDRSEKVGVSYSLGMAMTRLFTALRLQVPFLLHVDRYGHRYDVRYVSRRRPDLIGLGPTGWLVAEAKGRSNRMEAALRGKLQAQKRSIKSVAGGSPVLALACVAHFDEGRLQLSAFDPTAVEPESLSYDEIDADRFVLCYYEPFLLALDANDQSIRDDGFVTVELTDLRMTLGLHQRLLAPLQAARQGELQGLAAIILDLLRSLEADSSTAFVDGSFVSVEWDDVLAIGDYE